MKIILPCGAKKASAPAPAYRLYQGAYFRAALAWAQSVASAKDVFILSAKYGLIPCTRVIEPYEAKMKTATQVTTVAQVKQQAADLNITTGLAIFCGGKDYLDTIKQADPRCEWLWSHTKLTGNGMGYQIQWFSQNKGKVPARLYEQIHTN